MKKSKIQHKKLTKKELKEINGGAIICPEGFCFVPGSDEPRIGGVGKDGYCC